MSTTTGMRVEAGRNRIGLSQRALAKRSGVSQPTLSRIESGERAANVPELLALAAALGCPLSELTETSPVRDRVISFARASAADADGLKRDLTHLLELDAFLEEYGIC